MEAEAGFEGADFAEAAAGPLPGLTAYSTGGSESKQR